MSQTACNWAWTIPGLRPSVRITLLCLAHHHNANTGRCDPSGALIATETGLKRDTVFRALAALEAAGLIRHTPGRGKSNQYHLACGQPVDKSGGVVPKGGHHCISNQSQKGDSGSPKKGTRVAPKGGHKQGRNREGTVVRRKTQSVKFSALPGAIPKSVAQEWVEMRQRIKKPPTQGSLDRVMAKAVTIAEALGSITPAEVITMATESCWQGLEQDWVANKLKRRDAQNDGNGGNRGNGDKPNLWRMTDPELVRYAEGHGCASHGLDRRALIAKLESKGL